jgi:hypothetical protein
MPSSPWDVAGPRVYLTSTVWKPFGLLVSVPLTRTRGHHLTHPSWCVGWGLWSLDELRCHLVGREAVAMSMLQEAGHLWLLMVLQPRRITRPQVGGMPAGHPEPADATSGRKGGFPTASLLMLAGRHLLGYLPEQLLRDRPPQPSSTRAAQALLLVPSFAKKDQGSPSLSDASNAS